MCKVQTQAFGTYVFLHITKNGTKMAVNHDFPILLYITVAQMHHGMMNIQYVML